MNELERIQAAREQVAQCGAALDAINDTASKDWYIADRGIENARLNLEATVDDALDKLLAVAEAAAAYMAHDPGLFYYAGVGDTDGYKCSECKHMIDGARGKGEHAPDCAYAALERAVAALTSDV